MREVVDARALSMEAFFPIALRSASLLKEVQATRAFHGCINTSTLGLKRREKPVTAETLLAAVDSGQDFSYVSPEQTGRLNRGVDKRSDYYSLGVVFYELLTGRLPFAGHDPLELVHCHIAQQPAPPCDVAPEIPQVLSDIVLKLLSKNAEDRYQSIDGLLFDLARCELSFKETGKLAEFELGTHDGARRLQFSARLYGRQAEVQRLRQAFGRVVHGGNELFLICGYPGVGKSSLAHEIQRTVVSEGGIYLTGKFDQYKENIPYATLAEILRGFIRMLLASSEVEIERWRKLISQAVGKNGRLLLDLIPELDFFLGPQPDVVSLGAAEAQNRFFAVFREFVGVFATADHPLVIFLDDLQWLDAGSMRLLEYLATHPDLRYLLLIGSYRDNEVAAAHPLTRTLNAIRERGGAIEQIALSPLTKNDIVKFVADALDCDTKVVEPLAGLIYEKTAGNPFFTSQFLSALHERDLLIFEQENGEWRWDMGHIQTLSFTDNVADLMVARLTGMSKETQHLLKNLACIGASAPVTLLAHLVAMPAVAVESLLDDEQVSGILMRIGEEIRFSHDRIQEAAYSLIPPKDRPGMHLRIGRMMLSLHSRQYLEQNAFNLVYQLNRGIDAVIDSQEKRTIYQFNVLAGRKAKASVAFSSAREYLAQAVALLPPAAWGDTYESTFDLYLDLAECEFALGNFNQADQLLDTMLCHARNNHDRARVALMRIRMYFAVTRGPECLKVGLDALALFGVSFPESEEELNTLAEQGRRHLVEQLQQRRISDLIDLPVASDPEARMVISLLSELLTAAYSTRPAMVLPMLIKALNMSLQYGNTEESCVIYSNYGLLLAGSFYDVQSGYAFSEMSMRLNERFGDQKWRGRLLFIHGYAFHATQYPMATCLPILEKAYAACREVGNLGFAGASSDAMVWMAWETGMPLSQVMELAQPYLNFTRRNNTFTSNCAIYMLELLTARLQGEDIGAKEDELQALIEKGGWKYSIGHFYISQQIRHYTFGRYEDALAAAEKAQSMPVSLHALAAMVTHCFYHALTIAAILPEADDTRRDVLRAALEKQLAKLEKWAKSSPKNYHDRYALVAAEIARIDGKLEQALDLYEQAIVSARDGGFVQNEALANELAAEFYSGRGLTSSASGHLMAARRAYAHWGAYGKLLQLDQRYPQSEHASAEFSAKLSGVAVKGMNELDFLAVAKAAQAVSSEIVLGKLTESLLKIVVETAGAESGLLILSKKAEFEIAAQASTSAGQIAVVLRQSPLQAVDVPLSLFHYVTRTLERVLIDDAAVSNPYAEDVYFCERRSRSVLCIPLLKQARLLGVLYLENKLVASAFTPDRITMLEFLTSQAVISLENARLYNDLQIENNERKRAQDDLKIKTIELEAHASFMNAVIENIPVALFAKDARNDFRFTLWNKAAEDIFKIGKEAMLGRSSHDLWPQETADGLIADDKAVADAKQRIDITEQSIYAKGTDAQLLHTIKVPLISPEDGKTDYLIGISEDITDRKRYESMIWRQANFDALTGLPNRTRFRDQLSQDIERCHAAGAKLALLFIDLDQFKEVNDTLGHDSGDKLLIEAAKRIRACLRESDTLARLGGDEFTVILPNPVDSVETIAQTMINALVEPFHLGNEQAFISASIGVTIYPDDATEIEELLKHADQALYVAKDSGRNRFGYYTPALQAAALHRMRLTNDLRTAIERQEFQLYFQPIVDANSGRINKAEALIRWQHPQRGLVSPAEFIPLAESSGIIMEIGDWVFRESAKWVRQWRAEYSPTFQVSLNQSPVEFQRQEDRYARWLTHLEDIGLPGEALVVEITEGLLLDANPGVRKKLALLSDAGIQVALDDFGTGYSSLAYLKKFDIDYLKIDRAFIRNLTPDSSDMALIEAIIVMAHKLGLKVVAEGVETTEQHKLLRSAGCDYNQGYLFSRPVPPNEFAALLAMSEPRTSGQIVNMRAE
jgi:diguanylate cyclase (GGDEF)-like protein/PAS domain S-box-containing protein